MGVQVTENSRFNITGEFLHFASTTLEDTGIWECIIDVTASNVTVPELGIVPSAAVGTGRADNSLTVVGIKRCNYT